MTLPYLKMIKYGFRIVTNAYIQQTCQVLSLGEQSMSVMWIIPKYGYFLAFLKAVILDPNYISQHDLSFIVNIVSVIIWLYCR